MNSLISLLCRIASGERLEAGTKENTACWLSGLVIVPISMIGFSWVADWLEAVIGSPFDHTVSLILFIVVFGLAMMGAVFLLARSCRNYPWLLVLLSIGAWSVTAFVMWKRVG